MTKLCQVPVLSNGEKNNGLFGYTDKATIFEPSVTVSGRGTIGFSCVRKKPYFPIVRLITITPFSGIDLTFLQCTLLALLEQGIGTSIKQLTVPMLAPKLIPLPPLKEQEGIVSRIATLDPLIEEYDKVERELTTLNETFPEQIKKSILQYAIQGKLVPQDPNDEPASVLLEKIKAEKQKLIKAGKVKKDKQESYIYKRDNRHYEKIGDKEVDITDEIPFEIPDSWAWTRLGNLVQVLSDGTHKTPQYVAKGVPFLSVQNISSGKFDFTKLKYITQEEHSKLIQRVKPTYNDILFCRIGTLGKAIKCTLDFEFSIFVSLGLIRLVNFSMNDYMIILLNSPFGDRWIQENKVGGGTHTFKLNLVDIPHMLLPIPPLAEQDRIVAKVEKLLKLLPSND